MDSLEQKERALKIASAFFGDVVDLVSAPGADEGIGSTGLASLETRYRQSCPTRRGVPSDRPAALLRTCARSQDPAG